MTNNLSLTHVLSAQAILDTLATHTSYLRALNVTTLGLFGSFSRGTAAPTSDLDFLVTFETVSFDSYMTLKIFLEDLFGRNIDLVLEADLKPRFRDSVLSEVQYVTGL